MFAQCFEALLLTAEAVSELVSKAVSAADLLLHLSKCRQEIRRRPSQREPECRNGCKRFA